MLKRFSSYIAEAKETPAKGFDAIENPKLWNKVSGTTFEAELGKRVGRNPVTRKSTSSEKLRTGTKAKLSAAREILGDRNHEAIKQHSRIAAAAIKKHSEDTGFKINRVYWSSNPDDPSKIAKKYGLEEPKNSKADIIASGDEQHERKAIAIGTQGGKKSLRQYSLKYRKGDVGEKSKSKINYANPGLETMEQRSGAQPGSLSGIKDRHVQHLRSLGYTGSLAKTSKVSLRSQYEADKKSGDPGRVARAGKFDAHIKQTMNDIAATHRTALSHRSSDELEHYVRNTISPSTGHPEYMVDTRYSTQHTVPHTVKSGGKTTTYHIPKVEKIDINNSSEHIDKHIGKFERGSLHVEPNNTGNQIAIKGRLKSNGKIGVVMRHGLKETHHHAAAFNFTTTLK